MYNRNLKNKMGKNQSRKIQDRVFRQVYNHEYRISLISIRGNLTFLRLQKIQSVSSFYVIQRCRKRGVLADQLTLFQTGGR